MAGKKYSSVDKKPNIFGILKPYKRIIILLVFLTLIGNGVNLVIPQIISKGIDSFNAGNYIFKTIATAFLVAASIIFLCALRMQCA